MRNNEIYRNEIKSYIIRAGMTMSEAVEILVEQQRPQPVGQAETRQPALWRGCGAGRCAGVRHCLAETREGKEINKKRIYQTFSAG